LTKRKTKVIQKFNPIIGGIIGVICSILASFILIAICSWGIIENYIDFEKLKYCSLFITIFVSFLGSTIGVKISREKPLIATVVNIIAYFVVMVLVTAIAFAGKYSGIMEMLLIVVAGNLSVLLILNYKMAGKKRKKSGYR